MGNAVRKQDETDKAYAGIMAAMQRIKSAPQRPTLVDSIDDAVWEAPEAADWNINAGAYTDDEASV